MNGRVLIVGQGLAGTALGLELEAAGIDCAIVSDGHATAASRVAAGLINPITGQRFARTWRVEELRPLAQAAYRRWETVLGVRLWHDLRLERRFRDVTERERAARRFAAGELAPFARALTDEALVLDGAARVDLPALLGAAAQRWRSSGRLRETRAGAEEFVWPDGVGAVRWRGEEFAAVICCTGHGALARAWFAGWPFAAIKGQILTVRAAGLAADTVRHDGMWLIGEREGQGRVGATFERDREDVDTTPAAREQLSAAARRLVGGEIEVAEQAAGVRLALADRLPAIGWHPRRPGLGFFGALGSKGSLWAPWLAQRWCAVLAHGAAVPPEVALTRSAL